MNYLKLESDKVYRIALKHPLPRPAKDGFDGQPQIRWTLSDGRSLYTPVDFAQAVEALSLRAGEEFEIKRMRANGQAVFTARRVPGSGVEEKTSGIPHTARKPSTTPDLKSALRSAVSAAARAESEAAKIGYSVRFTSSDIADMAISIMGDAA
jgi:hypothetical protein